MPTNYFEMKKLLKKKFLEAGIDEMADIDWIMVEVLKRKRSEIAVFNPDIDEKQQKKILEFAEKRLKHIPLAYILGKTEFYGYEFVVDENVLIPRMDTEILIDEVLKKIKEKQNQVSILDVGTGSGVIAITLQKETGARVFAVDVSQKALDVAKLNAKKLDVEVEFIKSDLFREINDLKVDFIVSNPPYIESSVIETLVKEVKDNEPILALDGGVDGLKFYKKIVKQAKKHLNRDGYLFFEIGYNQAKEVKSLMKEDFVEICVVKDYGNNDRVVFGKMGEK